MEITKDFIEKHGFKRINNSMWKNGNCILQNGYTHKGNSLHRVSPPLLIFVEQIQQIHTLLITKRLPHTNRFVKKFSASLILIAQQPHQGSFSRADITLNDEPFFRTNRSSSHSLNRFRISHNCLT